MTTELVRNPKRRSRRNPKLSRGKKIGIALVSVAAVGGVTAAVIALRRRGQREIPSCPPVNGQPMMWNAETQQCEPLVVVGTVQGGSGPGGAALLLARAKRRMCLNPNALTFDQMMLLQQEVFTPLIAASPSPEAIGTAESVAEQALEQLCTGPVAPAVRQMATTLAQRAWENYVGFGG